MSYVKFVRGSPVIGITIATIARPIRLGTANYCHSTDMEKLRDQTTHML